MIFLQMFVSLFNLFVILIGFKLIPDDFSTNKDFNHRTSINCRETYFILDEFKIR